MFLKLFGLSLILHLSIILFGWIAGKLRGDTLASAFQTTNRNGGLLKSELGNRVLAISILLFVTMYTALLFYAAISTSLEMGANEPQVLFVKAAATTAFIFAIQFMTSAAGVIVLATAAFVWFGVWFISKIQVRRGVIAAPTENTAAESTQGSYAFKAVSVATIVAFVARIGIGAAVGAALFSVPLWAGAQIVEPGFEREVVADGFTLPTATAFTPDGRIFVAEKNGVVKVVKNEVVLATPLITLTDVNTFGDRGLIGMAIDPNFAQNGYLYLSYTYENTPGLDIAGPKTARIVRVTVVGDTASESSKVVLVGTVGGNATTPSCEDYAVTDDCIPSDSNSHSGGALAFGPDGKLYASLGDGADFAAVDSRALRAQNIDSLAGKVLRLNTDGTAPTDNPFFTGDPNSNRSKVYAFGFRNMFRLHFNQATGRLYGGDVGWSLWEEVNLIQAGANYGWPCREGAGAQADYACMPSTPATDPLYTYPHDSNGAGSIVLGAFATNDAYPDQYDNTMFIGDYAQQWIKQLNLDPSGNLISVTDFESGIFPVELNRGLDGNVYYIDIAFGTLNRITHTDGNRSPVADASATPTSGLDPLTVQFSSAGSFDPDGDTIGFAWNFGDGTFAAAANPSHTYTANGTYDATLVVSDVYGASDTQTVTITVGDQKPTAVINTPENGSFYRPGETIMAMGNATDPEDGVLPASAFQWEVVLHHNVHVHPVQQFTNTKMINFVADNHDDADVYMEVILTVTDSAGLTDSTSVNMYYNNAATTTGNIIVNPSVEDVDPNATFRPLAWDSGWFGSMNPTFTYPVAGIAGDNAMQIEISNYVSGNAKWFNTPVFVQPGEVYEFSNAYKSTTETLLVLQYGRPDGSYQYELVDTLPAAPDPTTTNYTITIPANVESISVFHEIASNGSLITDNYSLVQQGAGDTNPPTGSITNIVEGQTLSGIETIEIDATDAEGPVTKVHLYVDGSKWLELEDTTAPFALQWDTTGVADGAHTIQAHMHDQVDNHGLTAPITITVDNSSVPPAGDNLITNGDFEIAGPLGWTAGGWGANTRVHSIEPGRGGGAAAKVEITDYPFGDIGDAKWVHDEVAITPGTIYTFETYYQADTISDVIGRYTYADDSVSYFGILKEIQPAANWTFLTNIFVPPENAVSVTFFHLISSEGFVTIDDVSIIDENATSTPSENNAPEIEWVTPGQGDTVGGIVTLTADATDDTDIVGVYYAVNGQPYGAEQYDAPYTLQWDTTAYADGDYILKATTHDPYGNNTAVSITVTVDNSGTPPPPTDTNRITNAELEVGTAAPTGWFEGGWGTNDRTHSYPVTGNNGDAARVAITTYTSGDAKWYFTDIAVTPGEVIPFGNSYRANAPTSLTARFDDGTGTYTYQYIAGLPASATWTDTTFDITVPAGATSMTVFHGLGAVGFLEVDSYFLGGEDGGTDPDPDTEDPVVNITSPNDGETVDGVITITVDATDDREVDFVHLIVDGKLFGNDTTAAYSFTLDTTEYTNGPLDIRATAFDGTNTGESEPITIIIDNAVVPPAGDNLIANPGFEQLNGLGEPLNWTEGGYGDNSSTYNVVTTGSTHVAYVEISDYVSGDAKWVFDPVSVTPGATYRYSVDYASLNNNEVVVYYEKSDGSFESVLLGYGPAYDSFDPTDLNNYEVEFTAPAEAVNVTVFYTPLVIDVNETSYSYIDNVSLMVVGTTPPPPTDTNRITNAELEVGTAAPTGWFEGGWGTNDRTHSYPVTGNNGDAARVAITTYTSGDAKWYFTDIAVTPGEVIPFGNSYRANAPTSLTARFDDGTGTYTYQYIAGLPASATWTDTTFDITVPAGATSMTVFHGLGAVGFLEVDSYFLGGEDGGTDPDPDTEDPVVNITSPNDGVTLTGTVAITGTASDNEAVTAVRLYVDGIEFATDVTAPYTFNLNSENYQDGAHTFLLEAEDAAGNVGVSDEITVTVDNSTVSPPPAENLVVNGDLEAGAEAPNGWLEGGWGTNDRSFTYPVAGPNGDAARVEVTNYISGDAKWYFADVAVTAGVAYEITTDYRSNTATTLVVRYARADGSFVYDLLDSFSSTDELWLTETVALQVPADMVSMTIFHNLTSNGYLETDSMQVVEL